jgi:hypothetical protein
MERRMVETAWCRILRASSVAKSRNEKCKMKNEKWESAAS